MTHADEVMAQHCHIGQRKVELACELKQSRVLTQTVQHPQTTWALLLPP